MRAHSLWHWNQATEPGMKQTVPGLGDAARHSDISPGDSLKWHSPRASCLQDAVFGTCSESGWVGLVWEGYCTPLVPHPTESPLGFLCRWALCDRLLHPHTTQAQPLPILCQH